MSGQEGKFGPKPAVTFRKEVQDYIRACEHLISSALVPGAQPLTDDETHVIEFYRLELARLFGELLQKHGHPETKKKTS